MYLEVGFLLHLGMCLGESGYRSSEKSWPSSGECGVHSNDAVVLGLGDSLQDPVNHCEQEQER